MLKRNEVAYFDILSYFEGQTLATGVFEGRSGVMKRRFSVDMTGRCEGNSLVLQEHFAFEDGERQDRTWTLTRGEGQSFTGRCEDAIGEAQGHFEEGRAYLTPCLRLKVGNRFISMSFDDVFYDAGNGAVLNRSTVSKWGIRLGQVLIIFRKV
jgi:hypothetical protein